MNNIKQSWFEYKDLSLDVMGSDELIDSKTGV